MTCNLYEISSNNQFQALKISPNPYGIDSGKENEQNSLLFLKFLYIFDTQLILHMRNQN